MPEMDARRASLFRCTEAGLSAGMGKMGVGAAEGEGREELSTFTSENRVGSGRMHLPQSHPVKDCITYG